MNNEVCWKCNSEMELYGNAGTQQIINGGDIVGVESIKVYRCINPDCIYYNLLQGEYEQ